MHFFFLCLLLIILFLGEAINPKKSKVNLTIGSNIENESDAHPEKNAIDGRINLCINCITAIIISTINCCINNCTITNKIVFFSRSSYKYNRNSR